MDEYELISLKARMAEMEERLKFLYRLLKVDYELDDQNSIRSKIGDLLRQGKKIQAIKLYQDNYHVGLAEAKKAVEAIDQLTS